MYVNPFVAGVIFTILAELLIAFAIALSVGSKKN